MSEIFNEIKKMHDEFTEIRRYLHKYPELGLEEYETTKFIKKKLTEYNIDICSYNIETGVVALLEGEQNKSDKVVGLRADIDALPMTEKTDLEYSSQNDGIMHSCGHDGHAAILLGVAKYLSENRDKFSGKVKFIFQPGEETLKGAQTLVDNGVLKDPKPDVLVGLHGDPDLTVGKVGVKPNGFMASGDKFHITVKGTGGHGAYPHRSYDPILASSNLVMALQGIVSREINALDSAVISVCIINGGNAFNIIPEEIELKGTARCHTPEVRKQIEEKMERVIKNVVSTYGCDYEFTYEHGVPAVINDEDTTEEVVKAAKEVLSQDSVVDIPARMGSEDFSVLSTNVERSTFFRLGITKPDTPMVSQHNEKFDFNDEAIPYGMSVLTQFVFNQLS
ncbi:M20 metallopeptidase family protein [Natranaerobius trueperi]|uniref:Peptidase M20 n=1 Tax=Natranaerobius trueperi TaxID=759412 RepID=A0A226C166_9FIRM|nr:M20 family metallopeptidase [Natranaerobius trueperi]OWZ85038.1 peptidase M20 [Natranaerobius trueperi]